MDHKANRPGYVFYGFFMFTGLAAAEEVEVLKITTAAEIERMLEDDFARSRLMESGEFDAKPWWFRFGVRLARLTAPIQ